MPGQFSPDTDTSRVGHRHRGLSVAEQYLARPLPVALAGAPLDKDYADLPGACAGPVEGTLRLCREESWVTL